MRYRTVADAGWETTSLRVYPVTAVLACLTWPEERGLRAGCRHPGALASLPARSLFLSRLDGSALGFPLVSATAHHAERLDRRANGDMACRLEMVCFDADVSVDAGHGIDPTSHR